MSAARSIGGRIVSQLFRPHKLPNLAGDPTRAFGAGPAMTRAHNKSTGNRSAENEVRIAHCSTCGRGIDRKIDLKGPRQEIKYCSATCRAHKPNKLDRAMEQSIIELLNDRSKDGDTSSVTDAYAREHFIQEVYPGYVEEWRLTKNKEHSVENEGANSSSGEATSAERREETSSEIRRPRERIRQAARRLHNDNQVRIMQNKKPVDPSFAKGDFDIVRSATRLSRA